MSGKSKEPTIAEQIAKLDELIAWFESDDFVIEEAIDKFAEAEKLAAKIDEDLSNLKNEITVLKQRFDEA